MLVDFKLKVFMAVLEEQSFTKAARNLGISQPAVSQNIAELEKELGTELFSRSRGAVTPTSAGISFKEYASRILHWYEAASSAFNGTLKGSRTLRIASGCHVAETILPSCAATLSARIPGLKLEIVPDNGSGDIRLWCQAHSDELSLEDGAGFIGTVEAAAVSSNHSLAAKDNLEKLPSNIRFAVWHPYSSLLTPDIMAMTAVESYSPASICHLVSVSPDLVGLVPKDAAIAAGLVPMPVNLNRLSFDLMISSSVDIDDPAYDSLRNLLREAYNPAL